MLIVCNGSVKSGSTWLYGLVGSISSLNRIPKEFQNPHWFNSSIDPNKTKEAIEYMLNSNKNYYIKQHWSKCFFQLEYENIYVLNIIRDIRDMLVSRYFHEKRQDYKNQDISFNWFFNNKAFHHVNEYVKYHKTWQAARTEFPNLKYIITSYEKLHESRYEEIERIFKFCSLPCDSTTINHAILSTSLSELSKNSTRVNHHLRKGVVGDYSSYFDESSEQKLQSWLNAVLWFDVKKSIAATNPVLDEYITKNPF